MQKKYYEYCVKCDKTNCNLTYVGNRKYVCDECLSVFCTKCDACGGYRIEGDVKFFRTTTDSLICEDCRDNYDMIGKLKCALLREIRKEIAESNDVVYLTKECHTSKPCSGECDITKAEVRHMEAELKRKILTGNELTLDGIKLEKLFAPGEYNALDFWPCMMQLGIVTKDNVYDITLEALGLSTRSYNCLKRAGVKDVSGLVSLTDSQLKAVRNLGRKSYLEVLRRIDMLGLSLKSEWESASRDSEDFEDL